MLKKLLTRKCIIVKSSDSSYLNLRLSLPFSYTLSVKFTVAGSNEEHKVYSLDDMIVLNNNH